mgnify:FL=1
MLFRSYDMNEIVGSLGKISFSTFEEEPILLTTIDGTTSFDIKKPVHIQTQLIQSIVNELNGFGVCESTGVSGARTNKIMDMILKNYRLGKK